MKIFSNYFSSLCPSLRNPWSCALLLAKPFDVGHLPIGDVHSFVSPSRFLHLWPEDLSRDIIDHWIEALVIAVDDLPRLSAVTNFRLAFGCWFIEEWGLEFSVLDLVSIESFVDKIDPDTECFCDLLTWFVRMQFVVFDYVFLLLCHSTRKPGPKSRQSCVQVLAD